MPVLSFLKEIQNHKQLHFGNGPRKDRIYIVHKHKGATIGWELEPEEIGKHDWGRWEGVLTGRDNPRIMDQFTRICGYYSGIHLWNRSKLAELKDRQKGDYVV